MPAFSDRSLSRLETCHPDLQRLFREVVKHFDCSVIQGHRSNEEQAEMLRTGRSQLGPGRSKHNREPSMAVDVAPWPIDWQDWNRWYAFAGFVLGVASQMGIEIRSGLDWDGDFDFHDQSFMDAPHFELVDEPAPPSPHGPHV